jgi:tetrahydromethanopterin S-methyltransferase subunit A
VKILPGYVPERMISDRAGYFVVYPDRTRHNLVLEHYRNDGVLDVVIEGRVAAELYHPAIERGLISRLDHAAYLGRELGRAEKALESGGAYVQEAAPERRSTTGCGCTEGCGKRTP